MQCSCSGKAATVARLYLLERPFAQDAKQSEVESWPLSDALAAARGMFGHYYYVIPHIA